MAIDTSIYSRIKQPSDYAADRLRIQQADNQNKLAQLTLADAQEKQTSRNALADVYKAATNPDGTVDRNRLITGLAHNRQGSLIPGVQRTFSEQDKAAREAEKAQLEQAKSRVELIGQVAGSAKDPQSYAAGRALLAQSGVDVSNIPEQYDPAYVANARQQALTAAQQIEQVWKQKNYDLDERKFGYQRQNDSANRAVTMRGQNMTDARGREANDINRQLVAEKKALEIDKLQSERDGRERQKQASIDKTQQSIDLINKALAHPGREIATGKSGVIDPRNYMAGTDAKNFQVLLDQLGGQAFLQAFESLKGGGQITEVEGKKATDAMARLNRAQSDEEFEQSLKDLLDVYKSAQSRLAGGVTAPARKPPTSGKVVDFGSLK